MNEDILVLPLQTRANASCLMDVSPGKDCGAPPAFPARSEGLLGVLEGPPDVFSLVRQEIALRLQSAFAARGRSTGSLVALRKVPGASTLLSILHLVLLSGLLSALPAPHGGLR